MTPDRLPPYSPEAERALLGSIMIDPQQVLPACIEKLSGTDGAVMYDLRHQVIYETMVELWQDQDPVDMVSLQERLNVWGNLEQVGGVAYLSTLPEQAPSASNFSYYLEIVLEKHWLRQLLRVCVESVSRIYDFEGQVDQLLDEVERDVLRAAEGRVQHVMPSALELVHTAIQNIESRVSHSGQLQGIDTSFSDLNKITNGLCPGRMYVIGGRPAVGKTSLAMNIADHVAVTNHIPTGVFSLEMTGGDLMERMIASRARINMHNLSTGFLADRDFPKITSAASRISQAPLFIDDSGGLSILQLRAKARRMYQRHGVRLILIDYLQLMNATGNRRKAENRQQEIADISAGTKALAKELNVPVVVLAQLNRDIERDKNRKPRMSDLRESGATEQDADFVGLLYKPNANDADEEEATDCAPVNMHVCKNRFGPTGIINFTFLKSYTRYESAAKVSDEDVPDNQPQMDYAP